MRIATVGCGYVADFYHHTLANHRDRLEPLGVFDRDAERARSFARFHGLPAYPSLEGLLADDRVDIVLNLTNPESHYEVTKACLAAGKHVYSEKPLAMDYGRAVELVEQARRAGLRLASAPCNLLGETAQTMWRALRGNAIGRVHLAYAELDGGLKHRQPYRSWVSRTGAPWPAADEFRTGCTVEHAGYVLTWLVAFFGPARRVTSFAACLVPDKATDVPLPRVAPDFSCGCIEFESGVVARVTNSIVARLDHSLSLFGEDGTLSTPDAWDYRSPVRLEGGGGIRPGRLARGAGRLERALAALRGVEPARGRVLPPARPPRFRPPPRGHAMDFMRGVAELAGSIGEGRPCRLSDALALHVTEITLALQHPERMGAPRELETRVDAIEPMPWAR